MSNLKLESNEVTNNENSRTSDVVRATRQTEPVPWCSGVTPKDMLKTQASDPGLKTELGWLTAGRHEMEGQSPDLLTLMDGVIHRKFHRRDNTGQHWQLMVPDYFQDQILQQMHDGLLSGHLGRKKTKEKLLQRYY